MGVLNKPMLNIIGAVFKYSVLVVVVLVLSHVVQIRGVSISRHVEHALDWTGEFSPRKITRSIGSALSSKLNYEDRVEKIDSTRSSAETKVDHEISRDDEKQLHQIIHSSKRKNPKP